MSTTPRPLYAATGVCPYIESTAAYDRLAAELLSAPPQLALSGVCFFIESDVCYLFIPLTSDGDLYPFTGGLLLLLRATASVREPTGHLFIPAGGASPQIGRHRESIPGPPDQQTEALPSDPARTAS